MALKLTMSVLADVQKAVKGIDDVDKSVSGFGTTVKAGAQVLGSYLALDKIQGWASEWVDAARQAGKSTSAVGIIFADSAKQITDWSKANANALGFTQAESNRYLANMGQQLKGYGLSVDEAAGASVQVVERSAHVARVLGKDIGDVLGGVGSALKGRTAAFKEMGVNLDKTEISARLAAKGLGELEGSEANAAQASEVLAYFLERTNDMAGAIKPGGLLELNATIGDLKAELGSALLPILNPIIAQLTKLANWAQEHPTTFKIVTLSIVGLAAAIGLTAAAMGLATLAASPFLIPLLGITAAVVALAAVIMIVVRHWGDFTAAISRAYNWVKDMMNGLGQLVALLLGPVGVALLVVKNWEAVWRGIKAAVDAVAASIQWVVDLASKVGGFFSRIIPGVGGRSAGAFTYAGAGGPGARAVGGLGTGTPIDINVNIAGNVGDPVVLGRRIVAALGAYVEAGGRRELTRVVVG